MRAVERRLLRVLRRDVTALRADFPGVRSRTDGMCVIRRVGDAVTSITNANSSTKSWRNFKSSTRWAFGI